MRRSATAPLTTHETGLVSTDPLVDAEAPRGDAIASFSIRLITGGTGALANATGYLYVTGFSDPTDHVTSHVNGKICVP